MQLDTRDGKQAKRTAAWDKSKRWLSCCVGDQTRNANQRSIGKPHLHCHAVPLLLREQVVKRSTQLHALQLRLREGCNWGRRCFAGNYLFSAALLFFCCAGPKEQSVPAPVLAQTTVSSAEGTGCLLLFTVAAHTLQI